MESHAVPERYLPAEDAELVADLPPAGEIPASAFRIVPLPGRGLGCLATRRIRKHEVLLEENPVICLTGKDVEAEIKTLLSL